MALAKRVRLGAMTLPFDAVLLDMDGTLLDSEPLWHQAEHQIIEAYGATVDPEIQKTFTGVDTPTMIGRMRRAYGLEPSEAELMAELGSTIKALLASVKPRPGATELLEFLKANNVKTALVSNSAVELIETSLAHQPWREVLAKRFSAEHVEHAKPAPDIYLLAAKELGADPADCLVVEDSLTGVQAGVAAGMTCFAVPSQVAGSLEQFKELTPYVYGSLLEVVEQLQTPSSARTR